MIESDPTLAVTRLRATLSFLAGGDISSNWGATLRGGFGFALREISCSLRRESCSDCLLGRTCAYGYLFETPIRPMDAVMRKYTRAPHPFVFEPPFDSPRRVKESDAGRFDLVLIGRAHAYLPYILLSLMELGGTGLGKDRVPFKIAELTTEDGDVLYRESRGSEISKITSTTIRLAPGRPRLSRFTLQFDTPARIKADGRIKSSPNLKDIVGALSRRLFLIRYFHGNGEEKQLSPLFLDAAEEARLLDASFEWRDAVRYSANQGRDVPLGGVAGFAIFEGDLGTLEPLLRAGEYVHVGKNITFGLGKYRLVEGEPD